jgi:hypothetical protein
VKLSHDKDGYPVFNFTPPGGRAVQLKAHRVAWALCYDRWPAEQLDHVNGAKADLRIRNLREVTNAENGRNQRRSAANKSGRIGVHWHKGDRRWRASIGLDGRPCYLGSFVSFDEACAAREAAERIFGFHENHGSVRAA